LVHLVFEVVVYLIVVVNPKYVFVIVDSFQARNNKIWKLTFGCKLLLSRISAWLTRSTKKNGQRKEQAGVEDVPDERISLAILLSLALKVKYHGWIGQEELQLLLVHQLLVTIIILSSTGFGDLSSAWGWFPIDFSGNF
jgi:hypothetical protein